MRSRFLALAAAVALSAPGLAGADVIPEQVPDLPVLGAQAYRGNDLIVSPAAPTTPTPKVVDGSVDDWTGDISRFGGTAIYSRGEYVYQDYLMDDWGADDGVDTERAAVTDGLAENEPRTYRIEALSQAAGDQFDAPPPIGSLTNYGDAAIPAGLRDHADIEEVRVAADDDTLTFLVRTTGMIAEPGTAALVMIDTTDGGEYPSAGAATTGAEYEVLAIGDRVTHIRHHGLAADCAPTCPGFEAATNAAGYVNAIEISIDRSWLDAAGDEIGVIVGAGVSTDGQTLTPVAPGGAQSDLVNVAFRFDEPARVWMDHDQALALRAGNIDGFRAEVSIADLLGGRTETYQPRAGYYERVFETDSAVNREATDNQYWQGSFQHYGIYFPTSYEPDTPTPATWWTHYRGGHAHDAAAWVPGLIRQLGEQRGNIVITPGARGTSSWYVGRGHEDFLDVWDDSMASFAIDPRRVYMSGYSMGGFASWLLPLVYPDRFAAAFPTAGPPTQGLWAGVGPPQAPQNGGDAQAELLFDIIRNAANVGYVIYHGSNDELVPVTGVARMAAELSLLGYENRLYVFPGAEHYTNAIVDEWTEAARYLDRFVRDPNPPRVVYSVKPALERAVETVSTPAGVTLDYTFDGAYWVDGLTVRDTSLDTGTIDVTTLGRGAPETIGLPEAGTGGQIMPHVMTGLRVERVGTTEPRNAFGATLTNIATATLDVARMALETSEPITATITTDGPATITLVGAFPGGSAVIHIAAAGDHQVTIA